MLTSKPGMGTKFVRTETEQKAGEFVPCDMLEITSVKNGSKVMLRLIRASGKKLDIGTANLNFHPNKFGKTTKSISLRRGMIRAINLGAQSVQTAYLSGNAEMFLKSMFKQLQEILMSQQRKMISEKAFITAYLAACKAGQTKKELAATLGVENITSMSQKIMNMKKKCREKFGTELPSLKGSTTRDTIGSFDELQDMLKVNGFTV